MFGRRARIPVDILCGTSLPEDQDIGYYVAEQCKILEEAYRQVRCTMGLRQDRQKELYDRGRHGKPFQLGDLVMLYSTVVPRGQSKQLHCPWSGPYKVVKVLSEVTYQIQRCRGKRQRMVIHFDRSKPCPADMREIGQPTSQTPVALPLAPQTSAGGLRRFTPL